MTYKVCSITECSEKHYALGFCRIHYDKNRMYGDPLEQDRKISSKRTDEFMEAVLSISTRACIEWPFYLNEYGYGIYRKNGSSSAHQYACIVVHGPRPDSGFRVRHLCGNSVCVNPRHLIWGTAQEDAEDQKWHGTRANRKRSPGKKKLTEAQVREIRRRYVRGEVSQKSLAKEFSVSEDTISRIVTRTIWKRLL